MDYVYLVGGEPAALVVLVHARPSRLRVLCLWGLPLGVRGLLLRIFGCLRRGPRVLVRIGFVMPCKCGLGC